MNETACTTNQGMDGTCEASLCVPEGCGDGQRNAGEQCDDGAESASCNRDCSQVDCGDGKHNATAGEECDDGNDEEADGCESSCTYSCDADEACADDDVCDGEEFCSVDHVCASGTPVTTGECAPAICSNGVREEGELCDGEDTGGVLCSQVPLELGGPFSNGALRCNASCDGYDASQCKLAPGVACESDEQCDWACVGDVCDAVTDVSAGTVHTCALFQSGRVACWGSTTQGMLGNGDSSGGNELRPQLVYQSAGLVLTGVLQLKASTYHTCVVLAGGSARCWGDGGMGRLGSGSEDVAAYATEMRDGSGPLSGVTEVAVGHAHTCVRRESSVQCVGNDAVGILGDNAMTGTFSLVPRVVVSTSGSGMLSALGSLRAGSGHTCAKVAGGGSNLVCWGSNSYAPFGSASPGSSDIPVALGIVGATDELFVEGTSNGSMCARIGGVVQCWGQNNGFGGGGKLGVGSSAATVTTEMFVTSSGETLTGIRDAALGSDAHCYLVGDNTLYCAGNNGFGELGPVLMNGTLEASLFETTSAENPFEQYGELAGVAAGSLHMCVWTASRIACWGYNANGQLGVDGENRSLPVDVAGPVEP